MKRSNVSSYDFFQKMVKIKEFKEVDKNDTVFIKKYLKKTDTLVDIGCGWGRELLALAPACEKVIGIDCEKKELDFAKDYLKTIKNKELILSDAKELKLKTSSIDKAICLYNTLGNNMDHLIEILREVKRVLNKNGVFMAVLYKKTKNKQRFNAYNNVGLNPDYIKDGNIYFKSGFYSMGFTKDDIKNYFIKKAGYTKVKIETLTDISYFVVAYK